MFRIYSRSKGFIYVRQMNEATTKTLSKCTFTSFRCDIRKPFVKLTNLISTVWLSDLCNQFYCKKVKIVCLGFSIFIGYCTRCLFQFPEIAPNWIPLYSFLYFYLSVLPSEPNYYSFNIYRFIVGLTCWKKILKYSRTLSRYRGRSAAVYCFQSSNWNSRANKIWFLEILQWLIYFILTVWLPKTTCWWIQPIRFDTSFTVWNRFQFLLIEQLKHLHRYAMKRLNSSCYVKYDVDDCWRDK